MCAQCAIIAASVASGARSWVASRRFSWMTPRRLKLVTIALLAAALLASSVRFSGSTRQDAHGRPAVSAHGAGVPVAVEADTRP